MLYATIISIVLAVAATIWLVTLGVRNRREQRLIPLDADETQIAAYRERGIIVTRKLDICLTMSFPTALLADLAEDRLQHLELSIVMVPNIESGRTALQLRGKFAPTTERMRSLRIELELVAEDFRGRYDGWGLTAST